MARSPRDSVPVGGERDLRQESLDDPINVRDARDDGLGYRDALLREAEMNIRKGWEWWRENWRTAHEDVEFTYLSQWPQDVAAERKNRPMLTFNTLPRFINQVVGLSRQSQMSIQVHQTSGLTTPGHLTGGAGRALSRAEIMEGLIRDIEVRSDASREYCRALQHALEGGFGWLMVRLFSPPDDPFQDELQIQHVEDRYSILIDPLGMRANYQDAMWCQHSVMMTEDEYRARYPDAGPAGHPGGPELYNYKNWWTSDQGVRVSDYWWKEPMDRVAVEFENPSSPNADDLTLYEDEYDDMMDEIRAQGYVERRRATVKTFKVQYMRHTAMEILDGPRDWPSRHLPVVPVLGRQIDHDGGRYYQGVVRHARDPLRTMNYWMSAMTETVALAPKTPWLLTEAQIAGYQNDWQQQATKNIQYLLYNHDPDVPAPVRVPPRSLPQGEMQIVAIARDLQMDTIGIYEAGLGQRSNETSGTAIAQRRTQSDNSTFEFTDNLARAVTYLGEILCDMIPRRYTRRQTRRLMMPDGSEAHIDLNHDMTDPTTGQTMKVASLTHARYRTRVDVGPATRSQREEFVQLLTEWGKTDPEGFRAVRDLVVEGLDMPYRHEVAERFRHMVPRHMLRPEVQETLPPPQPTPEEQAEMAKAQAEMAKAQAEVEKSQAAVEVSKIQLEREKVRLQIEMERGKNAEDAADEKKLDDMVADALANRS